VFDRLTRLQHPADLRHFDVIADRDMAETAMQVARVADTFVALRPNGRASRRGWSEPAVRPSVFGPVRSKGDDALRQHRQISRRRPGRRGCRNDDAGIRRLDANLLVVGCYGHSHLRELLPGSTTDRVPRSSPFRLLIAH
jgi:hypothetical protein